MLDYFINIIKILKYIFLEYEIFFLSSRPDVRTTSRKPGQDVLASGQCPDVRTPSGRLDRVRTSGSFQNVLVESGRPEAFRMSWSSPDVRTLSRRFLFESGKSGRLQDASGTSRTLSGRPDSRTRFSFRTQK